MTKSNYKLTKEDFNQINRRSLFTYQWGWNYERMQASSYLYMILPQLRKMYGDGTPELKTMMKTHSQFFNTSPFFHTIIAGIDLALEEEQGVDSAEAVSGIKTGLMGPFASIGDAIFGSTIPAIFGAIAANMAVQEVGGKNNGTPFGILIWILANIAIMFFRWKQLEFAHKEGVSLVTTMQARLAALTDAATLLGVFMVGALVATMVNIKFVAVPEVFGVKINIQNTLDSIFPKLVPLAVTGFVYWLLGKKGMTSTKAIFIVIALIVALAGLGHLVNMPIIAK
ncbi:PTS fructose transporter subunit IID [Granulicatella sp. zg-ZJ]|uniref:PTS system mannose/fructose/sorbose family transporter subunit IID n=1 Tax=unclassified Granulicatella TaxID=2630493 RepID=UPI0013BFC930|nr:MULTISPECIES: PTS system mannose/fructose/sorbose family transporter subunit IID [unclassified Granulicatella]NEW62022.1 PTS fructose transporter subunit IID [Granulicatella sp. zg-ZJ]NEW66753.1 PTS fructose transporter subunit IID [Granulicatella sp. zg-84]QMI85969.1 PTS system mannose/fructose/sorbose family transporter subunit IID [Carnobacteriaceae bacterium zg-84]